MKRTGHSNEWAGDLPLGRDRVVVGDRSEEEDCRVNTPIQADFGDPAGWVQTAAVKPTNLRVKRVE